MKHKVKKTLRALVRHIGFQVRYVNYFDDDTHGKLLVREKRILINANKPRVEHFYTVLHEIGHFIVHYKNPPRDYCPGYLRKKWHRESINDLFKKARRYLRFIFGCSAGREWEADLWAVCAFILLAKQIGCRSDLLAFLERHPEKTNLFLLASGVFVYTGIKSRIHGLLKCVCCLSIR